MSSSSSSSPPSSSPASALIDALHHLPPDARVRSAQLQELLPTLEQDFAKHYKPFTQDIICYHPMSAVIALRFTIFQVSLCFFDPTKRPSLPRFLLDLFRGTSNQSTTQEPRRYPDPRLLAPWTESDNLHATAVFFLRIHPQATFYDLMQVLIMSLHTDYPRARYPEKTVRNDSLYNPAVPIPSTTQRLYRYLESCQARSVNSAEAKASVSSPDAIQPEDGTLVTAPTAVATGTSATAAQPAAATPSDGPDATCPLANIVPLVQNPRSGKTTALVQLAKHEMLGVILDLEDYTTRRKCGWYALLDEYEQPSDLYVSCFLACHLAAVSIQLTRLARRHLDQMRSQTPHTSLPLTLQEWRIHVVEPISHFMYGDTDTNQEWQLQVGYQAKALFSTGKPMGQDELLNTVQKNTPRLNSGVSSEIRFGSVSFGMMSSTRPHPSASEMGPIDYAASELARFFSPDADAEIDSLPALLVATLGPEQVRTQPLFFYALRAHQKLAEQTQKTLMELWKRFQPTSHWLILVIPDVRVDPLEDKYRYYRTKQVTEDAKIFFEPPPNAHEAFVDLANDAAWALSPPSSSAQTIAQLRGLSFAALECVSLCYGRPLWFKAVYDIVREAGAHFGPVPLAKAFAKVFKVKRYDADKNSVGTEVSLHLRLLMDPDKRLQDELCPIGTRRALFGARRIISYSRKPSTDVEAENCERMSVQTTDLLEPVCNAMAAVLFRARPVSSWRMAMQMLFMFADKLVFSSQSERSAQLILMTANDIAQNNRGGGERLSERLKNVSMEKILQENLSGLLGPIPIWKLTELLLCRGSDGNENADDETAAPDVSTLRWMQTRLVNFTHFARMPHAWQPNQSLPLETLVDGWVRQCAWVAQSPDQENWTLVIPVHRADADYVDPETGLERPKSFALHFFEPDWLEFVLVRVKAAAKCDHEKGNDKTGLRKATKPKTQDEETQPNHLDPEGLSGSDDKPDASGEEHASEMVEDAGTWRVGSHAGAEQSCDEPRAHMIISIDFSRHGSTRWLKRDIPNQTAEHDEMVDDEANDQLGRARVQRHDLWLYGQGDLGGLLDEKRCPLLMSIPSSPWAFIHTGCFECD